MRLRYSLVTRTLWSDARFLGLSGPEPNAQTLWMYLLTGEVQGPIPGLFRAGVGTLSDGLGWSYEATAVALEELLDAGMVRVSLSPPLLWIPRAIHHNPPVSPNVVKSWRGPYLELPETALREEAMAGIREGLRGESFLRAFDATFPEAERLRLLTRNFKGKPLGKASGKALRKASGKASPKDPGEASGKASEGGSDVPPSDVSGEPSQASRTAGKPLGKPLGKASPIQEQDSRVNNREGGTSPPRYGPQAKRLAETLREAIRSHTPQIAAKYEKPGKLLAWERDLERLIRLDGASEGEVRAVILWAHQGDESGFWRPNLLSGGKVREHFDRLIIQAKAGGARISSGAPNPIKEWMDEHHRWLIRWADEIASLEAHPTADTLRDACDRDGIPLPPSTDPLLRWLKERR